MPNNTLVVGNVEITVLHDAEVAPLFDQSIPDVPFEAGALYLERYPEALANGGSRRTHFES